MGTSSLIQRGERVSEERRQEAGKKFDIGKLRYDLVPVEAMEEVVRVLTYGASKYGDRNWEQGMSWSRNYAAAHRHLKDFWKGEDLDDESGIRSLAHAIVDCLFLLDYQLKQRGTDDRPLATHNAAQHNPGLAECLSTESLRERQLELLWTGEI